MSRSEARLLAFKLNYLYLNNSDFNVDLSLSSLVDEGIEIDEEERDFALGLFSCTKEHLEDIKSKFLNNLKNTTLSKVYSIDYAIIITAISEIDYLNEDKALVISEAVRIAKKYSTDKGYSFVNGILSSIYMGEINA